MKAIVILSALLSSALLQAADTPRPLAVGDAIPGVTVRTEDDQEVSLRKLVSAKPTVLSFYRGGWCPFCTRHLSELVGIEKDLETAGAQLLAISMDQPAKLRETPQRDKLGYRLLSDSDAKAAKAFGIIELASRPAVVKRALAFAVVVGTILIAINHGDAILAGPA